MDIAFNTNVNRTDMLGGTNPLPIGKETAKSAAKGAAALNVAEGAGMRGGAADVAGLGGAAAISEQEPDRKDDLGLLFARAFGAALPPSPDWPDP